MSVIQINATQVQDLLPMKDCIQAVRDAMVAFSRNGVQVPLRGSLPVEQGKTLLYMPGACKELGFYGVKLISLHSDNAQQGLPTIQGVITLFDYVSGEPKALIEGSSVTGLRTAAASGLATDLLARAEAKTLGIFGAGLQAETHIDAITAVRPIQSILVWARNYDAAVVFADKQSERTGLSIRAVADPAKAAECDIVCTVTAAAEPILKREWVKPGAHINLVGSHSLSAREADTALIVDSRLYVDSLASTVAEAGDVMIPVQEGAIDMTHIIGEIGLVASGDLAGRLNNEQITLYKSVGMTAQDLFSAASIYRRFMSSSS
jgi:ornithine cyclodeaminase/alanine dehydrogenase-like protein (mu-crystallin family)